MNEKIVSLNISKIFQQNAYRSLYLYPNDSTSVSAVSRTCRRYLVVRVDGVGVQRGVVRGRHDGVRHVRRHAAPVARAPPLARVVQHLRQASCSVLRVRCRFSMTECVTIVYASIERRDRDVSYHRKLTPGARRPSVRRYGDDFGVPSRRSDSTVPRNISADVFHVIRTDAYNLAAP